MSAPTGIELDGSVSDLIAMFAERFPGWAVTRTEAGWWAHRGSLLTATLTPDGRSTVKANTPAELYVRLEDAAT